MLRNIVKTITIGVMILDILLVFIANPIVGIGRIIFFSALVWAWKLYEK